MKDLRRINKIPRDSELVFRFSSRYTLYVIRAITKYELYGIIIVMNRWIRMAIQGDMFYIMAFGLLTPIFALFLKDQIPNADLFTIGIAEGIYLLTVGTLRPFTQLSTAGDKHGWRAQSLLWFGSALVALTPFLYLLSRDMLDIFVIQMLYGVGIAFSEPAWSRLVGITCKLPEKTGWEPFSTTGTLAAAGLAAFGGFIAQTQGMRALFFYVGITLIIAAVFMSAIYWRLGLDLKLKKL